MYLDIFKTISLYICIWFHCGHADAWWDSQSRWTSGHEWRWRMGSCSIDRHRLELLGWTRQLGNESLGGFTWHEKINKFPTNFQARFQKLCWWSTFCQVGRGSSSDRQWQTVPWCSKTESCNASEQLEICYCCTSLFLWYSQVLTALFSAFYQETPSSLFRLSTK